MRKAVYVLLLLAILLFFSAVPASCEDAFTVKRIGNIVSFNENRFLVHAPESGALSISVHDDGFTYRTLRQQVPAGDTEILWDGCGWNRERLSPKSYTITATLITDGGEEFALSFLSPVEYTGQSLQYALPSSDSLSLLSPDDWFLEYKTVMKGQVKVEFVPSGPAGEAFSYVLKTVGGRIYRKTLSEIAGKSLPAAGCYTLRIYETTKPDIVFEYPLEITDQAPASEEIFLTGEIMPDASMTDAEIWSVMMQPSVVVDIDFFEHQKVFEQPDQKSASLGTLHGQTQALKVLSIRDEWALVGAWNHEAGDYIEGWVPVSRLKVERPRAQYGILIDKKKQTLSVFENGKRIDTILVSTGRAEKNKLYQETAAGSFLTGYHRVDFSMNGKKYDYVVQYDGGNLLHQIPYEWGSGKKDFTLGRGYLGAKASHACIRIQAEPGDGGVNAYWIWTHIPYHTRVIVLDDAEERVRELDRTNWISAVMREELLAAYAPAASAPADQAAVSMTFAGCSFDTPFSGLANLFRQDDLTCVQFHGSFPKESEKRLAAVSETAASFEDISLDLLNLTGIRTEGKDAALRQSVIDTLAPYAAVLDRERIYTREIKRHLFGFASCSESEYLFDPPVIDRRISLLRSENCDVVVFCCDWASDSDAAVSVVQQAMAQRCVSAGANLVVGHQSGVLQGLGTVDGVPVIWSLGDVRLAPPAQKDLEGLLARVSFTFGADGACAADVRLLSAADQ